MAIERTCLQNRILYDAQVLSACDMKRTLENYKKAVKTGFSGLSLQWNFSNHLRPKLSKQLTFE